MSRAMGISSLGTQSFTNDIYVPGFPMQEIPGVTIISGQASLTRGTMLGLITSGGVTSAAKSGGNTGNGVLTLDATTPKLTGSTPGVYQVRCIGGLLSAAKTDVTGSGKGAITLASPAYGADAKVGVYKIVFIEPATNLGNFQVEDPDGIIIGTGVAGSAFDSTHVKFTIADGSTDFAAGDTGLITITQSVESNKGTFSVTDPDGNTLGTYVAGAAAFATQVKFTIADGSTDFVVGDGFDITVAAAPGKYKKYDSTAVDQEFAGILGCDTDATSGDEVAFMYISGRFIKSALSATSTITAGSYLNGNIVIVEDIA